MHACMAIKCNMYGNVHVSKKYPRFGNLNTLTIKYSKYLYTQ